MKKLLTLLCLLAGIARCIAQTGTTDSAWQKVSSEKNDSVRFYLIFNMLTESETNPVLDMENAEKLLVPSEENNDKVGMVLCIGCIGYDYRAFGNNAKSMEYNMRAYAIAQETRSPRLIAAAALLLAQNYLDLTDYKKALAYNTESLMNAAKTEQNIFTIMSYQNMGDIYLGMNKIDSALACSQMAYQLSLKTGIREYLGPVYGQLGDIEARMKNGTLAISYFNLALDEAIKTKSPKFTSKAYHAIANYYYDIDKKDSAIAYARKAISVVQHTAFFTMTIKPAKLLLDIYRGGNIDSAFKYSEMHRVANDSLYNIKAIQQAQLMTFEEEARREELLVAASEADEKRKENIEYALMALGIVSVIVVFLLLSRSVITNERIIEFFGVVGLLLVFEFLNLVLHPFLEKMTHHSPVLMLLALVSIAAILVPLHHKLEKWATHRLIEKNKAIRLIAAKKAIEQLNKETK